MSFGIWNISGLKNKLSNNPLCYEYYDFAEFIMKFDIFGFVETWSDYKNEFCINGYTLFDSVRKKHAKAIKNSGGLCLFVKSDIVKLCKPVRLTSNSLNILWVKFNTKDVISEYNIIIGLVYMSPEGSSIHSDE